MSRHIAVVGKPDRPSPDINSRIVEINFNPYWTVPVSIVRKDLIPKMQAEPVHFRLLFFLLWYFGAGFLRFLVRGTRITVRTAAAALFEA